MNRVNIALIGISGFAAKHFRESMRWHCEGRAHLIAAAVINQAQETEKVKALHGISCEVFTDYREMLSKLRGQIDLCIIPTGIHLHTEMALAALEAGCNVLLEKPVAATLQEVDLLGATAKKKGKILAIGFQHIYSAEAREIKRTIVNGALGEIQCIKSMGLWPRPKSYYKRNNWAGRLQFENRWVLDSPLNNAFAHWLNLMCFFAGDEFWKSSLPQSIRAELYRAYPIESADTACLQIGTEAGVPLYFWVSHCSGETINPVIEIRGSKGSVLWDDGYLRLRRDGRETLLMPRSSEDRCRRDMYEAVIDKISGGPSYICDIPIARNQTICVDGAFEASEIHTIPAAYYDVDPHSGDPQICIRGIGKTFRDAFAKEQLFSEMGVNWATEAGSADLKGYAGFFLPH